MKHAHQVSGVTSNNEYVFLSTFFSSKDVYWYLNVSNAQSNADAFLIVMGWLNTSIDGHLFQVQCLHGALPPWPLQLY